MLGPTPDFFAEQYNKLLLEDSAKQLEGALHRRSQESDEQTLILESTNELGGGTTTPMNEVSTVITLPNKTKNGEDIYLFTGDAGPEALDQVISRYGEGLKSIKWLDVPHHGSRRGIRQDQIDHFSPKICYVSGKGGPKHPSVKLVNALKKSGSVYSTHYSVGDSWLNRVKLSSEPLQDKELTRGFFRV